MSRFSRLMSFFEMPDSVLDGMLEAGAKETMLLSVGIVLYLLESCARAHRTSKQDID